MYTDKAVLVSAVTTILRIKASETPDDVKTRLCSSYMLELVRYSKNTINIKKDVPWIYHHHIHRHRRNNLC